MLRSRIPPPHSSSPATLQITAGPALQIKGWIVKHPLNNSNRVNYPEPYRYNWLTPFCIIQWISVKWRMMISSHFVTLCPLLLLLCYIIVGNHHFMFLQSRRCVCWLVWQVCSKPGQCCWLLWWHRHTANRGQQRGRRGMHRTNHCTLTPHSNQGSNNTSGGGNIYILCQIGTDYLL